MAVPHTRPTGVTAHATRRELIAGLRALAAPGAGAGQRGHLLEFRLGRPGEDAMGFAVHVPHYLAQTEYPAAAETLLDAVSQGDRAGAADRGAARGRRAWSRAEIDQQIEQAEEAAPVVRALEEQYDAFVRGRGGQPAAERTGPLPTADELGAELERFLAEQTDRPDQQ